jgi:hypothetical protein
MIKLNYEPYCLKAIVPGVFFVERMRLWLTEDVGDDDVWPNVPKFSYSRRLNPG